MFGFIMALVAGAAMSVQGVFNTRLSDKIGLFESNMIVQGSAFILALIAMWIFGSGNLREIAGVNKLYLSGGIIGFVITLTVVLAISKLNTTLAISTILIAQLLVAALIDAFGWFGTEKVAFGLTKYIGIALMIAGVLVFKR